MVHPVWPAPAPTPPSRPPSPLPTPPRRVQTPLQTPLLPTPHRRGIRGRALGRRRSLDPSPPSWWWGRPPLLRRRPGLPLGRPHIPLSEVGASAVRRLGHHVRAWPALPSSAPLDGALMAARMAVSCTERAPGGCGDAAGLNAFPLTAPATEDIWQLSLKDFDLLSAA